MSSPQDPDGKPTVYRITDARKGITEDVNARQRRYLISMGIRTVCFVLAIFASSWLRWLLVVAALLLPYIAVIIANAGREPAPGALSTGVPDPPLTLPAGPTGLPGPEHGPPTDEAADGPDQAAPRPAHGGATGPTDEGVSGSAAEDSRGGDTPH